MKPAWPVLAAYAAALMGSLLASESLVVGVARSRAGGDPAHVAEAARSFALSLAGLASIASVNAVILVGVSLGTARLAGGPVVDALRLGRSAASAGKLVAAVAGTAGLSLACGAAAELVHAGEGTVLHAISSALHGASPTGLAAALVTLCVLPAVAEETLFRGLMQTRLAQRWGRIPALIVTSAAFGLMHLDPVQGTIAFVVGLYLGTLADRLGSIRPGILAHGANNALFVCLAAATPSDSPPNRKASVIVLVAGLSVLVASLLGLRERRRS